MPKKDQAKILREIDLLEQFGISLVMPHVKMARTDYLWELRVKQGSNNYRVFYFTMKQGRLVLLHAFRKKHRRLQIKKLKLLKTENPNSLKGVILNAS